VIVCDGQRMTATDLRDVYARLMGDRKNTPAPEIPQALSSVCCSRVSMASAANLPPCTCGQRPRLHLGKTDGRNVWCVVCPAEELPLTAQCTSWRKAIQEWIEKAPRGA
jgi:hypothetical protein